MTKKQKLIQQAFAKYRRSEGCSCCRDDYPHQEAEDVLGELLECPRYSDDSGWDWSAVEKS